jgi:hypothetical protein
MAYQYLGNPYSEQKSVGDSIVQGQQIYSNTQKAGADSQKLRAEEIKRLVSIVTPENYSSIRQEGIQQGLWGEQDAPADYESAAPVIQQLRQSFGASAGSTIPSAIQEYNFYKNLPDVERGEYMKVKRSPYLNTGDAFTNPYAENDIVPINPKASETPKFEADVAAAKAQAVKDNDFLNNFNSQKANSEYTINLIDNLIGNEEKGIKRPEGFEGAVGLSSIIPNRPGGAAKSFENRLAQIGGKQFLEAFESLKGGGQITQIEGEKASNAIARMQASNSEKEFIVAAKEFRDIVKQGLLRANEKYQRLNSQDTAPIDFSEQPIEDLGSLTDANMEAPIDAKRARLEELRRKAGR